MPIFVYKCADCLSEMEELMKDKLPYIICPVCDKEALPQITAHSSTPSLFGDFAKTYQPEYKGKK